MIDYILRLDIKPLTVHNDRKRRSTTLTSFESVLDSKKTDLTTKENITANLVLPYPKANIIYLKRSLIVL